MVFARLWIRALPDVAKLSEAYHSAFCSENRATSTRPASQQISFPPQPALVCQSIAPPRPTELRLSKLHDLPRGIERQRIVQVCAALERRRFSRCSVRPICLRRAKRPPGSCQHSATSVGLSRQLNKASCVDRSGELIARKSMQARGGPPDMKTSGRTVAPA